MKANNNPPLCIHCRHFTNNTGPVCKRPDYDTPPSLVTGEVSTIYINEWAAAERREVGWFGRLLGFKNCGSEGRYFMSK